MKNIFVACNVIWIVLAGLILCGKSRAEDKVFSIRQEQNIWRLETPFFIRDVSIAGDILQTTKIVNKITHESYLILSDEFQLTLDDALYLTNKQFKILNIKTELNGKAGVLICELDASKYPFSVEVRYTIWNDKPYLRKAIKVRENDGKGHILNYAQIECMSFDQTIVGNKIQNYKVPFRDYYQNPSRYPVTDGSAAINDGQPVFGEDLFMGVEFPAAINKVLDNGKIGLGAYVQKRLSGSWTDTRTAVLGFSSKHDVEDAFMSYVNDIRNSPAKPRIVYNTWYDIQDMNETNMLQRVEDFKTYFKAPFNFNPDLFLLDDGWDNTHSIWEIDSLKFPHGFTPIVDGLHSLGINFGLWVSPFGGYDVRQRERITSAKNNGYEITDHGQYCIAGTKYRAAFKKCFIDYMKKYKVKFFKLDGILNICNCTDHGHLPGEPSRAALADAYLEIMKALKDTDPEVCLNITSGFWLSPWWLQYVDMGYPGGFDWWYTRAVPSISKRDASTVFRDKVLYDKFAGHRYMYPVSDLMLIGLIKGQLNMLGGYHETLQEWCNEVSLMLMRGYFCWELYITPSILSSAEREFMVKALQWGKENADLLSHTKLFLGDPYKRELTGYAHCKNDRGIIGLRNPFIDPQKALIPLDKSIDISCKADNKFVLKQLYPYLQLLPGIYRSGDKASVTIDGYETKVIEIIPLQDDFAAAYRDVNAPETPFQIKKLDFNLNNESDSDFGDQIASEVFLPHSGNLCILLEGEKNVDGIDVEVTANGIPLKYTVEHDSISFGYELNGDKLNWRWQIYQLTAGNQKITFSVRQKAKTTFAGFLGAWIRYATPLIGSNSFELKQLNSLLGEQKIMYPTLQPELKNTHRLFYRPCVIINPVTK